MRKILVSFILLLAIILSCKELSKQRPELLGINQLNSQLFKININKDTVLKTLHGAFLDIPKGSLSAADSSIQLEIKEAYSIEEIIKAKLTTQSNGQPLSSGGMIYINAVAGQKITITKAIRVAVPTNFFNNKMKLYNGEKNDSGINWTNPTPLTENPIAKKIDEGEILFKKNCGSCHKVEMDFTAPALAHVINRRGKEWVYGFSKSHNDSKEANTLPIIKEADKNNYLLTDSTISDNKPFDISHFKNDAFSYTACLKEAYVGAIGTQFPNLKMKELDAIYKYIQNETERLQIPYPNNNFTSSLDSCEVYYTALNKLLNKRKALQKDSLPQKIKDFRPPVGNMPSNNPPVYPDNSVEHEDNKSLYYQFKIDVVGWYNIDALLNEFDGKTETELRVRIIGSYKTSISINLVVPVINTFLEGGKLSGTNDEYGFFTKDGKIPLPKNAKAYIIAMGETEGKLLFAKKEFIVSEKQSIDITPVPTTIEVFNSSIKTIGSTSISIKAIETQTGKDLKENDKQLKEVEKLKPKKCSCDCGLIK